MSKKESTSDWKALDFQAQVRPLQLQKLQAQLNQIQKIGQELESNNKKNLKQIDLSYKETAQLENQVINKKQENQNLIVESEMAGIKFPQNFGECTRESDSLQEQVLQIQQIIYMLQNELSLAECQEQAINEVYDVELKILRQRDEIQKQNEVQVFQNYTEQIKATEEKVLENEKLTNKQVQIRESMNAKQNQVINQLQKQNLDLVKEREALLKDKQEQLQAFWALKTSNSEKKANNDKLQADLDQVNKRVYIMEESLDKIVSENIDQFGIFQDQFSQNNSSLKDLRNSLTGVKKQYFEMENINETLEQRIDWIKGQKDLSVILNKAGLETDLKTQQTEAEKTSKKLQDLFENTEFTWEDQVVVRMRQLDDAVRQASEESINSQVQTYLQQIRDKNREIERLTQAKENLESKMKQEVPESELMKLKTEHATLIKDYEEIVKIKLQIFHQMISNLKDISDGNARFIENEQTIADRKIEIEIWDRDIYQKKRVAMDKMVEIQQMFDLIEEQKELLEKRKGKVEDLHAELEQANAELDDFLNELQLKENKIQDLNGQINDLETKRARAEAEELERQHLEELARLRKQPEQRQFYIPVKGDPVDQKVADHVNKFELEIPIQRLSEGNYMFGSKKIFAKIMNDKLVIRVGGGFMLIDEFLATYAQQEYDKLNPGKPQNQLSSPQRKGSPSAGQMWARTANRASPNVNRGSPNAQKRI